MPNGPAFASVTDGWQPIIALLAADGSLRRPGFARLAAPRAPLRDLADAVHCLCLLHGHRPGAIDIALGCATGAHDWLQSAAVGFAAEREWLARLVSAAGPLPSTPNQTAAESVIATQRHALEMLARSDRQGCALGAAVALVLDWQAMRPGFDRIGERLGLAAPPCQLPDPAAARRVLALAATPTSARGLRFGAEQLLAQHRGLWSLIDARASARPPH